MNAPLPPQYNPALIERDLYQWWLDRDLWRARLDDGRPSYVVMLPPPNVTASLHMGHGLNQAIQDALVRFATRVRIVRLGSAARKPGRRGRDRRRDGMAVRRCATRRRRP